MLGTIFDEIAVPFVYKLNAILIYLTNGIVRTYHDHTSKFNTEKIESENDCYLYELKQFTFLLTSQNERRRQG